MYKKTAREQDLHTASHPITARKLPVQEEVLRCYLLPPRRVHNQSLTPVSGNSGLTVMSWQHWRNRPRTEDYTGLVNTAASPMGASAGLWAVRERQGPYGGRACVSQCAASHASALAVSPGPLHLQDRCRPAPVPASTCGWCLVGWGWLPSVHQVHF